MEKNEKMSTEKMPMNGAIEGTLQKVQSNVNGTVELTNVKNTEQKKNFVINSETKEELKTQLCTLMDSLATLSVEKSRMEANFQADRRQLRAEREEYEKIIKDLNEKLKRAQHNSHSEVEHVKYRLIMERHERDKNQADNSAMIKELQRLVTDERRAKELLEQQLHDLKSQVVSKAQNKILEAELEKAHNKLKQAEAAIKGTPPMLLSLQAEISTLRKQHRNAIHEERKRAAAAEQQAKILETAHEARVAGLEARLAELSETVGGYDRLRNQDQHAIQKLKEQLSTLQIHEHRATVERSHTQDPTTIAVKMEELCVQLMELNNNENSPINVKEFLKKLTFYDEEEDLEYKKKYDSLLQEFDNYKQQIMQELESVSRNLKIDTKQIDNVTELQLTKSHWRTLEERIRMINKEINRREEEWNAKLQQQSQLFQREKTGLERLLSQNEMEFREKISTLEDQLLRQCEQSLALIEEKDKEIMTLKSSFRAILTNNNMTLHSIPDKSSTIIEKTIEPSADFINTLLTVYSPPLLHYAQELARLEIQVTELRKENSDLKNTVRENQRDLLAADHRHVDEIKELKAKIIRLQSYKSREGANLEYLKNVLINYLTTSELSSKRHMLNAIIAILKFTDEEIKLIQRMK